MFLAFLPAVDDDSCWRLSVDVNAAGDEALVVDGRDRILDAAHPVRFFNQSAALLDPPALPEVAFDVDGRMPRSRCREHERTF